MKNSKSVLALGLAAIALAGGVAQARETKKTINDFINAYEKINTGTIVSRSAIKDVPHRSNDLLIQNGHLVVAGGLARGLPYCEMFLREFAESLPATQMKISSKESDPAEGSMTMKFVDDAKVQGLTCKSGQADVLPSLLDVVGTLKGVITFPQSVLISLE
jgi:hypothetical protein